jgi:hypothetical protein
MRLTIPHFLEFEQCKSPPIGGCNPLPLVNEWDDSTGPNMSPIYDLILDLNGDLLIQMVEAIDASDAWRLGQQQFPNKIRGVVFNEQPLKFATNASKQERHSN